jgi:prophage regulatory protein
MECHPRALRVATIVACQPASLGTVDRYAATLANMETILAPIDHLPTQQERNSGADRLLPLIEVARTIGTSRSKLYELMEVGDFPRPVKIGRRTHFSDREVQSWIVSRLAARDCREVL